MMDGARINISRCVPNSMECERVELENVSKDNEAEDQWIYKYGES